MHGRRLPVSSRGGRDGGALWGLFYESTNPIPEEFALMTQNFPKAHLLRPTPLGMTFLHMHGGRGTHTVRNKGSRRGQRKV